jgi:hypothetical protein
MPKFLLAKPLWNLYIGGEFYMLGNMVKSYAVNI